MLRARARNSKLVLGLAAALPESYPPWKIVYNIVHGAMTLWEVSSKDTGL